VPSGQWTTGVFFRGGKAKPAFKAWKFPFVTHRKSKGRVKAWGKAPVSGKLKISQKRHGHWSVRKRLKVRAGKIFRPTLHVRGKAKLRAQVKHTKSVVWIQSR
jgi:hypothetical protein